jgi:hypothetical protein
VTRKFKHSPRFDAPLPEPIHQVTIEPQHDVDETAIPKRDQSMARNARAAGMLGRITASATMHPSGRPPDWTNPQRVESIVMRIVSPDGQLRGFVSWEDGRFHESWLWFAGTIARRANRNSMAEILRDRGDGARAFSKMEGKNHG